MAVIDFESDCHGFGIGAQFKCRNYGRLLRLLDRDVGDLLVEVADLRCLAGQQVDLVETRFSVSVLRSDA